MPPKRKAAEKGGEELEETSEGDLGISSYSTASSDSSRSSGTVSSEQLELILAANSKSMAASMTASSKSMEASMTAILAALTPSLPVASASAPAPKAQIKVPKWTDEETPNEYFNKFEKALTHNGVDKATWGHLLPVYLAGKA